MATEEGTKRVEQGQRNISSVRSVIDSLGGALEHSSDRARQIAGASRQQAAGVEQIEMVVSNLSTVATQNLEGVRSLEQAADGLNTLGRKLQELGARYTT